MKKLTGSQVRQMFLDFFQEKEHQIEASASLYRMKTRRFYGSIVVLQP